MRVKTGGRPPRPSIHPPNASAGHRHISSRKTLAPAGRDSDMGIPYFSVSWTRKLPALFDGFGIRMHQHQEKSKSPSSRLKDPLKNDTEKGNVAHTIESAPLANSAERFPLTLPAAQRGKQMQKGPESKESNLTDAEEEVWYECDQTTSQGTECHSAQREYRVRLWWKMIRLALQVDLDSSSKCSPALDARPCPKVWKHSGSNFFPPWCSHLEQYEIIEAVLEEQRLSQHSKAG